MLALRQLVESVPFASEQLEVALTFIRIRLIGLGRGGFVGLRAFVPATQPPSQEFHVMDSTAVAKGLRGRRLHSFRYGPTVGSGRSWMAKHANSH